MGDDIVTRLRRVTEIKQYNEVTDEMEVVATFRKSDDALEAADEIERLRKQRNELAWAIAWFLNGGSREKLEARFKAYEETL